jgi:hypothetical protein
MKGIAERPTSVVVVFSIGDGKEVVLKNDKQ